MKLIAALETLKARGITRLAGLSGENNIDKYIDNARRCDEDAEKYADQSWAKYHTDHNDDHYILELAGRFIIATRYDRFDMVTYSNFDTEEEATAAFDEWTIQKEAAEIADRMMIERPDEFTREMWLIIALNELREAKKAAMIAFERDFPREAAGE